MITLTAKGWRRVGKRHSGEGKQELRFYDNEKGWKNSENRIEKRRRLVGRFQDRGLFPHRVNEELLVKWYLALWKNEDYTWGWEQGNELMARHASVYMSLCPGQSECESTCHIHVNRESSEISQACPSPFLLLYMRRDDAISAFDLWCWRRLLRVPWTARKSAYRFLKRQVRWSGIPISFRIFHSFLWSTQSKALA